MTLLICPVRPGDKNEELRYALRSWETNLVYPEGLTLLTVGHKPAWLEPDHHIEGNRFKSMPHAVFDNVLMGGVEALALGHTEVVYMNDDFFCLDPTPGVLPVRRNCTLAEHVAKFPANAGIWWPQSLRLTASWLADEGFPHPYSYEVHRPLLARPQAMVSALNRWLESGKRGSDDTLPQWRTVYGVLNEVEAHPVPDGKLGLSVPGFGTPWISTSDETWRRYSRNIVPSFQKPSRWER